MDRLLAATLAAGLLALCPGPPAYAALARIVPVVRMPAPSFGIRSASRLFSAGPASRVPQSGLKPSLIGAFTPRLAVHSSGKVLGRAAASTLLAAAAALDPGPARKNRVGAALLELL